MNQFNEQDYEFMGMALEEAKISFNRGDVPAGSVLTIDNELFGKGESSSKTSEDWTSHSGYVILHRFSTELRNRPKSSVATLYTTWEPCLTCLSIAYFNRINRIVYACPDPDLGATKLNPKDILSSYEDGWPKIESGIYKERSCKLLIEYMKKHSKIWKNMISNLERISTNWER